MWCGVWQYKQPALPSVSHLRHEVDSRGLGPLGEIIFFPQCLGFF